MHPVPGVNPPCQPFPFQLGSWALTLPPLPAASTTLTRWQEERQTVSRVCPSSCLLFKWGYTSIYPNGLKHERTTFYIKPGLPKRKQWKYLQVTLVWPEHTHTNHKEQSCSQCLRGSLGLGGTGNAFAFSSAE